MGKAVPYVFLAVSLAFFLFLIGLTGYRIETTRRANTAAAGESSREILDTTKRVRDSSGSFDSPYFKEKMREYFSEQSRLLVLTVHGESQGILYLIARNQSYLKDPQKVDPQWRGTPTYQASPGYETLFTQSFPSPDSEIKVDALYIVFGREDLYPILRDDLYLLLAFLIVCGIVILIASSVQEEPARPAEPLEARWAVSQAPGGHPEQPEQPEAAPPPPPESLAKPLFSPASGLCSASYFNPRLSNEIERASSSDQDLSVAVVGIDNPPVGQGLSDAFNGVAGLLKEAFPLHDLIFESGDRSFALILPDNDIDQAIRTLEAFRQRVARSEPGVRPLTISAGASARGGRLVDAATLREEADVSLRKSMSEGGNRVIGFRASPAKFRETFTGLSQ